MHTVSENAKASGRRESEAPDPLQAGWEEGNQSGVGELEPPWFTSFMRQ